MSEEEIIHYIELCIENKGIPSEGINWVKGLLDLYYKQKEDIMYLRTDAQDLADDVEFWQNRCDNSVDKDDIKHKIMELEDKERLLLMSPLEKQYKVQVLNEILEEN